MELSANEINTKSTFDSELKTITLMDDNNNNNNIESKDESDLGLNCSSPSLFNTTSFTTSSSPFSQCSPSSSQPMNGPVFNHSLMFSRMTPTTSHPAIRVRNLNVTYGHSGAIEFVLNNITMTVPKGCIYGLLGPSGCGKTTLIKCIMGLKAADSGDISIFNYATGSRESGVPGPGVGYMPQEAALSRDLTIRETWTFFGKVNFLSSDELSERIASLITLLDLPSADTLISQLSGGQQRRVSFGVTILHNPRLLILDEPTVGVDPILRSRIWRQLINTARLKGVTVIITTHYIEETRKADVVGFMRKGAIIAENSPTRFMSRYGVNTLEAVFHKLCYIHKRTSLSGGSIRIENKSSSDMMTLNSSTITGGRNSCNTTSVSSLSAPWIRPNDISDCRAWWIQFTAILTKYNIQIVRQPETLLAAFVLPIIILLVFCVCIGGTPNGIPIGLINNEICPHFDAYYYQAHHLHHHHEQVEHYALDMTKTSRTIINSSEPCLSLSFLSSINNYMFDKRYYTDYSQALDDVASGQLWGVLRIKQGFTDSLLARLSFQETDSYTGNLIDVDVSSIEIHADLTSFVLTRLVIGSLSQTFLDTIRPAMTNPKLTDLPIEIASTVFGSFSKSDYFGVRDFAAPGLMIVIVYSIGFALTAFTLILEKQDRTLDRNYSAGLGRIQIILGQLVTRFVFLSLPVTILLVLSVTLLGIPCRGSFVYALFLLLMQILSGMAFGVFISTILPSIFAAAIIANGVLLITFIISGVMWSIDTLPYYLRWVSVLQPTTAAAESFRSILVKGLSLDESNVSLGYLTSASWVGVWLTLATFSFGLRVN